MSKPGPGSQARLGVGEQVCLVVPQQQFAAASDEQRRVRRGRTVGQQRRHQDADAQFGRDLLEAVDERAVDRLCRGDRSMGSAYPVDHISGNATRSAPSAAASRTMLRPS
jgi:hypothetical protein